MPKSPASTTKRHAALRDILAKHRVGKQDRICVLLRKLGYDVTQSSVSRDLRDIGAVKVDGRYVLAASAPKAESPVHELAPWLTEWTCAGPNLMVIRTPPGRATGVALALDGTRWSEVAGTLAGDDTVFVATRSRGDQARLEARLVGVRGERVKAS